MRIEGVAEKLLEQESSNQKTWLGMYESTQVNGLSH